MSTIVIAQFETKAGNIVEIWGPAFHAGPYTVFDGKKMVQDKLTPEDCIRYLAHRLQGK